MEWIGGFDKAQRHISASLIATTRSTARIANEDVGFHRSSDPPLNHSIEEHSRRLLALAQLLLRQSSRTDELARSELQDLETTDASWKTIVDTLDHLLERADIALDEYAGYFRKRKDDSRESSPAPKRPRYLPKEFRTQVIPKPQLLFPHKAITRETAPFRPILQRKPHALVKLEESTRPTSDGRFPHPYQHEIEIYQYPPQSYEVATPIPPTPFESTQAIFVDDVEAVHRMLKELRSAKEIAIDLEHHDTHSYVGIVSLMQISTREQDWIIDTLKPWRRELEVLNEVFTDPNILKILHGAQMDVIWLQRDFGLYLVGLFDTYHASRALGYSGHSLAYLLKKFVNFDAQKQYQTADWRIRPLPTELFNYARSDTHFLLYVYDNMRNELLEKSFHKQGNDVLNVLQASKEYALQRYEYPRFLNTSTRSHNGWFAQLIKSPANFTDTQLTAYRKLYEWRDHVGREEDESTNYIMPNFVLQNIVRALPTDQAGLLLAASTPSHILRARAGEITSIISESFETPDTGAEIRRDLEAFQATRTMARSAHHFPVLATQSAPTESISSSATPLRIVSSQFWGSEGTFSVSDRLFDEHDCYSLTLEKVPQDSGPSVSTEDGKNPDERTTYETGNAGMQPSSHASVHFARHGNTMVSSLKKGQPLRLQKHTSGFKEQEQGVRLRDNDESAFNYSGQDSIMQEARHEPRRKKSEERAHFNPFAKAAEAQGGLGRAQSFRSGRTATFNEGMPQYNRGS